MIKVTDNEGELLVILTDVLDKSDLRDRFDKEDQDIMDVLFDTPFFGDVVGSESDYGQKESDFVGCEVVTLTYEEWMSGCREWADGAVEE